MHRLGLGVLLPFQRSLDGAYPTYELFQCGLGMSIGLKNGFGGFTQIMELAELMGHPWQQLGDGLANRLLAVGDHPSDRYRQRCSDLTHQGGEIFLRTAEQRAS